jgi:hypothetical protein
LHAFQSQPAKIAAANDCSSFIQTLLLVPEFHRISRSSFLLIAPQDDPRCRGSRTVPPVGNSSLWRMQSPQGSPAPEEFSFIYGYDYKTFFDKMQLFYESIL